VLAARDCEGNAANAMAGFCRAGREAPMLVHVRSHDLNRKDFSLCTPFQYFPPKLITCAQPVTAHEGYFRAANLLEPIFSEKFSRELNAFAGTNSAPSATRQ
jgi:hypothetical protein